MAVHFNIRRGNKSNVMDFYQPGSEVIEKFNNAANYAVLLGKVVEIFSWNTIKQQLVSNENISISISS